ncbi:MAG: immunoglobulin domain-containing protein [Phycisphaerae bacterium]
MHKPTHTRTLSAPCYRRRAALPIFAAAAVLFAGHAAFAQTGYVITGGLSNFDCGNHCDEPCDEFETEIEGCRPEDVVHCYHNSNYGSPTVTLSASGLSTIIDYRNPQHLTAVGAVEHFGVTLRQLSSGYFIRVRWMRNGHTATVNGQIPLPGGGTAPATQPLLPSIAADLTQTFDGDGIACVVTNNDFAQWIWVQRRAQVTQGTVALESLMSNDPLVTTSVLIDPDPVLVGPGQSLASTSDLVELEEQQSVVFAAEYFQDLGMVGPFSTNHSRGPSLGNVMTATIASPASSCQQAAPLIETQPHNVTADAGHEVQISVSVEGNGFPVTYQWTRDGQPIANGGAYHGATSDELSIDSLSADTEGFYNVQVSSDCGTTISDTALVFITGHNPPPAHPCDPAATAPIQSQSACFGGVATFFAISAGDAPITYQWELQAAPDTWTPLSLDGVVLDCGGVAFADTPDQPFTNVLVFPCPGVATYPVRCVVSNACGTATGTAGSLFVFVGPPGDANGDALLDGQDIQPFVALLLSGTAAGPGLCAADINQDGVVDLLDIEPLVIQLLAQ